MCVIRDVEERVPVPVRIFEKTEDAEKFIKENELQRICIEEIKAQ